MKETLPRTHSAVVENLRITGGTIRRTFDGRAWIYDIPCGDKPSNWSTTPRVLKNSLVDALFEKKVIEPVPGSSLSELRLTEDPT